MPHAAEAVSVPEQTVKPRRKNRNDEKKWSQSLPDDGDFQNHKAEIRIPALSPGYYALLSSPDKNFSPDTLISLNRFWSSDISYISRRQDDGSYELYVLDRQEGLPLEKIKVQSFFREYEYNKYFRFLQDSFN